MYIFNLVLLILTMQKPTVNIYHDLRRPLVSGLYPVRIRVANNQTIKYYNTDVKLSVEDYEKQRDCEALRANGKLKMDNQYRNAKIGIGNYQFSIINYQFTLCWPTIC